jgi:hypothetical protein
MIRRTALPLGLLLVAFGAFAWGAASLADSHDLAGIYLVAVGLVAMRAQERIAARLA